MNAEVAQMNVPLGRAKLNHLSGAVIGAAQKVSSTFALQVSYEGVVVGDYIPDLLIQDCLIAEIKATASIESVHRQQRLNYLRVSNLKPGLILNFGHAHLEVGRVVFHF